MELKQIEDDLNEESNKNDWYKPKKYERAYIMKDIFIGADLIKNNNITSENWRDSKARDCWGFMVDNNDWQPIKEVLRNMGRSYEKMAKKRADKTVPMFEKHLERARKFYQSCVLLTEN